MNLQSDICVIGNGAIGKVSAVGFAQAGLSVTLLCPPAAVAPSTPAADAWDVRVYALNQAAQVLLSSLKVWEAMDATRIAPVAGMQIHGDSERHRGSLAFDAYSARSNALAWIVEDRNINQALDAALRFAPNVRVITGVAESIASGSNSATVKLANGDTLDTSLIVGADGAQSWVRGQFDIDIDYRPYRQRAIVSNFECEFPHHSVASQWFTSENGVIALLPLAGQRVSLVWSAPETLAETLLQEPLDLLAQRLSALPGQSLGLLTPLLPETVKALPLALIRPRAITAPRVALVGDAAHVIHPLAGQGMNLGFADVAALLKTVAEREIQRDCGDQRILQRYERSRKEDILLMQIATDGLERLFSIDFEPVRVARNVGLSLLDKIPFLKRSLISRAFGKNSAITF